MTRDKDSSSRTFLYVVSHSALPWPSGPKWIFRIENIYPNFYSFEARKLVPTYVKWNGKRKFRQKFLEIYFSEFCEKKRPWFTTLLSTALAEIQNGFEKITKLKQLILTGFLITFKF